MFVIGGVTYSEMRCAYQVSETYKSCEVVIGKLAVGKGEVGLEMILVVLFVILISEGR